MVASILASLFLYSYSYIVGSGRLFRPDLVICLSDQKKKHISSSQVEKKYIVLFVLCVFGYSKCFRQVSKVLSRIQKELFLSACL